MYLIEKKFVNTVKFRSLNTRMLPEIYLFSNLSIERSKIGVVFW